ncbi:MAG: hypothetical protein RIM84_25060 [Alphaproteobacteria bacterium]
MRAPLIHIGYHRAGSTWLQRFLFGEARSGFAQPFDRRVDIAEHLISPNALDFDAAAAGAHFAGRLDQGDLVPVLSAERLSGYPDSGGYDSAEIARRLRDVFPDGRVLIVIRRQADILLSFYKVYVQVGGHLSLADYVAPPSGGRLRMPRFDFAHFAYHRLIGHYQALFGVERVMVQPFEDIASRPETVARHIARFAGLETVPDVAAARRVNASLSGLTVAMKRRLNPFFLRDAANGYSPLAIPGLSEAGNAGFIWLDRRLPAGWRTASDRRLAAKVARLAAGRYAASNRATQDLTDLDLATRGYDV